MSTSRKWLEWSSSVRGPRASRPRPLTYGRRFATVEPVFGNLRHNKQLNRFTLRRQKKMRDGSSTAWYTTSRSWRITGMRNRSGIECPQHAPQTTS
ncbi:MAG: transposase [Thiobacillus sp.]|nr:transposase [Thiobacillus sp.]